MYKRNPDNPTTAEWYWNGRVRGRVSGFNHAWFSRIITVISFLLNT